MYVCMCVCMYVCITGEIVGVVSLEELGKRKRDGDDYTQDTSKRMSHVMDSAGLELSHKRKTLNRDGEASLALFLPVYGGEPAERIR